MLNHYKAGQFNLAIWPASQIESECDWEYVQEDLQFEGIAMHNCGTVIGAQEVWAAAEQLKEDEAIASYVNNVEGAKAAREELKSRFLESQVDHARDCWRVVVDRAQCQLPESSILELCQLAAAVAAGESYRVYCWVDGDYDSLDPTIDHGYAVPEWISFYEAAPELAQWFGTAVLGESVELVEYDEEIDDYDELLDVWSATGFDPLQGALF